MSLPRLAALMLASLVGGSAFADDPEPLAVIEELPLTAIGQHSPAISGNGGWFAYVKYAIRDNGDLSQDLYVRSMDGDTERRITSSSLVYHPTWRNDLGRIVCVAVPEKISAERRPGLYQVDPSGQTEPLLLEGFARDDIPFAPVIGPEDEVMAYLHYANDPNRPTDIAVYLYNLSTLRLIGELPELPDGARVSESSGPWWHTPRHVRVLGERATDRGVETSIYEADTGAGKWRKVHTLKNAPGAASFAFSMSSGRLAWLQQAADLGRQEVMVADKDGKNPQRVAFVSQPYKHLPRPFANDLNWLPDGRALVVTSGPNLVLLRLGRPGEGGIDASKQNMTRIYNALMQYAYDHGGELPHWDHNPEAYGVPGRDPFFWVTALGETYLPGGDALYCALDPRNRGRIPSSYRFNSSLAGKIFDNEAQKRDLVILEEAETWHDQGRLVLYTDGTFEVIPPEED